MVTVQHPTTKYAQCNSCLVEDNLYEILIGVQQNNRHCVTLCTKCLSDLTKQLYSIRLQSPIMISGYSIKIGKVIHDHCSVYVDGEYNIIEADKVAHNLAYILSTKFYAIQQNALGLCTIKLNYVPMEVINKWLLV